MKIVLTEQDERELILLKNVHVNFYGIPYEIERQKIFLEATRTGDLERLGVDATKKYLAGALGFLEREQGKLNGNIFYYSRSYVHRITKTIFYLDSIFKLEEKTTPYAHFQEKQLDNRLGTSVNRTDINLTKTTIPLNWPFQQNRGL